VDLRIGTEGWLERWLLAADIPRARSSTIVAEGDPPREVLAVARRTRAEILVIGGCGGGRDSLLEDHDARDARDPGDAPSAGAAGVLSRSAPCSVLIVPRTTAPCTPPPPLLPRHRAIVRHMRRSGESRRQLRRGDGDDPMPPAAADTTDHPRGDAA
jgi:hypothetical protein